MNLLIQLLIIANIVLLPSCKLFQKSDQQEKAVSAETAQTEVPQNDQSSLFKIPLVKAAAQGNLAEVTRLLNEGTSADVPDKDVDNMTALMVAAHHGKKDIVQKLLDAGARVDLASRFGVTPLMFAADGGQLEIIEILIKHGANVAAREIDVWNDKKPGRSAFMFAIMSNQNIPIVTLLLNSGTPKELINTAYRIGDIDNVTPLMYAASFGYTDIVNLLIKAGANVNQQNSEGVTALMWAAQGFAQITYAWGYIFKKIDFQKIKQTIEILLKNGADKTIRDNQGKTALDYVDATIQKWNKALPEITDANEKQQALDTIKDFEAIKKMLY